MVVIINRDNSNNINNSNNNGRKNLPSIHQGPILGENHQQQTQQQQNTPPLMGSGDLLIL